MNRFYTTLTVLLAIIVGGFLVSSPLHVGYYAQYNALLREIQKYPNLRIIDHWRHEDLTLEDFGFAIRGPHATYFVDIEDGSPVRTPADRAVGISMPAHEFYRVGNTVYRTSNLIRFDSPEWQARGLPPVRTLADVIEHFDPIATSLATTPLTAKGSRLEPGFIRFAPARGRKRSSAPAQSLSKLGF